MIAAADLSHCAEAIRHGSRSFHAASRLLPRTVRDPALALYAFCRLADDAVDLRDDKTAAVLRLAERLERAYAGRPFDVPADRAFAALVEEFEMPRALPEALLEGLAWDAEERRYRTMSDLRAYSARVAAAVGAMMCVLMRVRDADALARACDLGVAMQLTNIARDVGEDARAGRLYLPLAALESEGIDPEAFLARPAMTPELGEVLRRLLREAEALYLRAEAGIAALPVASRPGIFAARFIYAGIGAELQRLGLNAVDHRARTSGARKLGWLAQSGLRAGLSVVMPRSSLIHARPLDETAFLVEAARDPDPRRDRSETMLAVFADLKARDLERRAAFVAERPRAGSPV